MLNDIDPDIELTVSDIRESALNNLKKRYYSYYLINNKISNIFNTKFFLII